MIWHPRAVFGLAVRVFGLFLIYRALPFVAAFIDGKLFPTTERPAGVAAGHLVYAMLDLSLAALFLLGPRTVVAWSYGDEAAPEPADA